ncbi:hypothetical protein WICPIJ_000983 [Wickerhamomyces pijperi]|uniref:Uncharacterized protein n=1 Tax=Wickerhamomyces pijperi TaxID=599730 RepID=A0A9P8QEU7_WICPI|nr:hypothetical protein WICPIJ_000983 [Wickerhamomyces pijperi]
MNERLFTYNKCTFLKDLHFNEFSYLVVSFTKSANEPLVFKQHRVSNNVFYLTLPSYLHLCDVNQRIKTHDRLPGATETLSKALSMLSKPPFNAKRLIVQLQSNPNTGTYHTDLKMYTELIYPCLKKQNMRHEVEILKVNCDIVEFGRFDTAAHEDIQINSSTQHRRRGVCFENKSEIKAEFNQLHRSLELTCLEHVQKVGQGGKTKVLRTGSALFEDVSKELKYELLDLNESLLTDVSVVSYHYGNADNAGYFQRYSDCHKTSFEFEAENVIIGAADADAAVGDGQFDRYWGHIRRGATILSFRRPAARRAVVTDMQINSTTEESIRRKKTLRCLRNKECVLFNVAKFKSSATADLEPFSGDVSLLNEAALRLPRSCTQLGYLRENLQAFCKLKKELIEKEEWDSELFEDISESEVLGIFEEANLESDFSIRPEDGLDLVNFARYLSLTTLRFHDHNDPLNCNKDAALDVFTPQHSGNNRYEVDSTTKKNIVISLGLLTRQIERVEDLDSPVGNFKVSLLNRKEKFVELAGSSLADGSKAIDSYCNSWKQQLLQTCKDMMTL